MSLTLPLIQIETQNFEKIFNDASGCKETKTGQVFWFRIVFRQQLRPNDHPVPVPTRVVPTRRSYTDIGGMPFTVTAHLGPLVSSTDNRDRYSPSVHVGARFVL